AMMSIHKLQQPAAAMPFPRDIKAHRAAAAAERGRSVRGGFSVAKGLDSLKVKAYTRDRVPNDYPGGDLPWQTYHTVRNALVRTCRRYGPTGPMGVLKIVPDVENPLRMLAEDPDFWERGDPDPMYFILDDQLNHERYCYAELYG